MDTNNILIIDDEKNICDSLKECLTIKGYQVFYKISPEDGLKLFAESNFPVVMLDVHMPEMDGIDVLQKIKKINPATVVILMTGVPSDETISKALSLGAYDYLVKPLQLDRICFLVERAFAYYKMNLLSKRNKG